MHINRAQLPFRRDASVRVTNAGQNDRINNFVNYFYGPRTPGMYQQAPGAEFVAPDTPRARNLKTFGGIGGFTRFRAPAPPAVNSSDYEAILDYVKAQGERTPTIHTQYDTETAYFWRESSPIQWNRFAHNVIGKRLLNDVVKTIKFYLQVNYAMANAAIAGWDSKSFWTRGVRCLSSVALMSGYQAATMSQYLPGHRC